MNEATTGSDGAAAAVVPTGIEDSAPTQAPEQNQEESSPLDSLISRIDEYISNPSRITRDTLMQLKNDLMDLKSGFEGQDDQAQEPPAPPSEPGSLSHGIEMRQQGQY